MCFNWFNLEIPLTNKHINFEILYFNLICEFVLDLVWTDEQMFLVWVDIGLVWLTLDCSGWILFGFGQSTDKQTN